MNNLIKKALVTEVNSKKMVLTEGALPSENLQYHINEGLTLSENVFRIYSDEFFNLINEVRNLYQLGMIHLNEEDKWIVTSDIGKTGLYEGDTVWLDIPFEIEDDEDIVNEAEYRGRKVDLNSPFRTPGGPKKFAVYVKTPSGNVKIVRFGDPNLRVRNNNPGARKSFRARHKCDQKKDKTKAGYWSCNVARYRKKLGIKSSSPW
jgi:hypothetical protein